MNWRGPAILIVLIGVLVALWFVISAPRRPVIENFPDMPPPRQLAASNEKAAVAREKPAEVQPAATKPEPAQPEKPADAIPPSSADLLPLHVADYGDTLKRSASCAEFDLVDAANQPLDGRYPNFLRLWRKLGPYSVADVARFDRDRGVVVCEGLNGAGLEPGDYDLEFAFGPYGAVRHSFSIGRHEVARGRIALPNWRRIACLRFVDTEGKAVPYLYYDEQQGGPRSFSDNKLDLPVVSRVLAEKLLRDPPQRWYEGGEGFESRRARGSSSMRGRRAKVATDEGRYYLLVFAGTRNRITVPLLPDIWGSETISLEDSCEGPQWDDYVIRLNLAADFEARLVAKRTAGDGSIVDEFFDDKSDPGHRSILNPPPKPPADDPRDLSGIQKGKARLLVRVDGDDDLKPLFWLPDVPDTPHFLCTDRKGDYWVIEVNADTDVEFILTDEKLYDGDVQRVSMHGVQLKELRVAPDGVVATLAIRLPSPTMDTAMVSAKLSAPGDGNPILAGPYGIQSATHPASNGSAVNEDREPILWQRDMQRSLALHTRIGAALQGKLRKGGVSFNITVSGVAATGIDPFVLNRDFQLSTEQAAALAAGSLTLDFPPTGLLLRAVGSAQGGVPFVEGSVIEYERAEICLKMRDQARQLHHDGGNLALQGTGSYADENAAAFSDDELKLRLGADIYDALGSRAAREFFCASGAWYDTRVKVRSDAHGYVVADGCKLVAGKRYVLFLWSATRDDLEPDVRVDFVATEGFTDLGAITVPDYR